jgi:branched-subunit amino acid permease
VALFGVIAMLPFANPQLGWVMIVLIVGAAETVIGS